ncbi:hypothetical protein SO802_024728 [Lithocarpus litseifolius]|uniref:ADP-ribosyl cyclase/cyclic ADP-ribose hydrolase n=1 Tax=Lithocarpus litseifolius TaxID=425828 RepID=A0AAW2CF91_9ROSI
MGLFTPPINEYHVRWVLKNQYTLTHTNISLLNSKSSNTHTRFRPEELLLQRLNPLHLLLSSGTGAPPRRCVAAQVVYRANAAAPDLRTTVANSKGIGVWKLPTGFVNEGEELCTSVIREVKEETGVETEFVEVLAFSYEAKVVQEIAESIYKGLNHELPHISENLVGINYRVQEMMNLFGRGLVDVRFIGIWGMARIGKTTQAYELYREICQQLEVRRFIFDVKKTHEKHDLVYLQNKLLFEIFKEKELYIWNSLEWSNEIKKRLHNGKVVIVIDDVDKDEQLQALAGSSDWFGPGSRIIITCRDKNLLERNHINIIYRAKGLYDSEALELFSRTVFKKPDPKEEFEDLPWEFVKYAKGHPLAITILGCKAQPPKSWFSQGLSLIRTIPALGIDSFLLTLHPKQDPINLLLPRLSRFSSMASLDVFQKDFEENEIIDTCFAQCEIPQWFCEYEDCSTVNTQLNPNAFDNLNCMGIAVCALFSFHKHPTAVRMDKDSGISHDFHCLLRANSRPVHRVWKTISEDKISISLTPRKFIWVLFFPSATLLDYLSETESSSVHFEFRTEGPDLSVQNWEFKPIVRANKDELMLTVVHCSTPPGSVLDCCDPKLVQEMWYNLLFKMSVSLGLCYHYEGLYPQPQSLFICEGKTSGTAQYSYDQFRYFNPSTLYNSCFPTRRTLEWFNYQSRGHLVTIDISQNLYDDNNWIGLALYASFSIPKDYTAVMKNPNLVKWSHFLYCQLQTSRAGQDDQIRVCQINDEETNWLFTLYGFTWISYIPGEAFKDMLHQCDHIKASFVSDWGGVTVQKCGVRLLYQHDQLQFERELQNCNALISGYRDFMHSNSSSFVHRAIQDSSSTSIEVSFVSDWPGVTVQKCGLCFYYEHDEWLQTIINNCWQEYLLQDHINLKMIGKSKFNPNHNDEAGPLRTSSGVEDEDHHEIPRKPNIAESSGPENQLSENDPQPKDQRSQNDLLMFDRCLVYNAWFPLSEILEWCNLQSDVTHVTIPVPPNLYNDCAWLGLALIASFEINVNEVAILDIQDSEASFNLICYLGSDIEGVKRFYTYDLTKDILELLHQGGLVWLCYIPRESFRDSLNQCSWIKALIQTNCPGLTVQKCGLHLSYDHDEAEQKEIKRCCKAFFPHRHEVRSSVPSSSNNNDAQPERQRQCFNDEAGPRRTSSSIEDLHQEIPRKPIYTGETSKSKQLGENDPHPKDQHYQSDLLDFDRCLVYSSCLPPCKILEWFRLQSDEPQLRIPLPPNLYNDSAWMGLALCIAFEVNVNEAAALDIEDSETSWCLICHLEASIECVEPLHVYCLTREHLKKLLQLGGFNWLFYISHGSFRDSLNQCT